MTAQGEIKPGYKQTEVGVIPADWDCSQLDDFISFISYGFTNPMPTVRSGVYMVTAADVDGGRVNYDTARYTSREAFDKFLSPKSKPKKNDILLTKDGALGRVALVGNETICINQSVAILRPNNRIDPQYLSLLLQADPYQRRMIEDAGGSTIKHIYITIVNRMPIAVPKSKDEQRAIAAALADADGLIAALEGMIAKKRDLKQAAMQHLLTGKTRLPGFSGEWEVKRLGDVIEKLIGGGTPSRSNPAFWGKEIPWVTVKDFATFDPHATQEYISEVGLKNSASHLIPKGTLITSTRMALGMANIYEVDVAINQDLKAVFLKPTASVDFLFHWFAANAQMIDGLGSGSTVKGISVGQLRSLPFLAPPTRAEQVAIAEVLSDMDANLAALEAQAAKARAVKQGMMQELLTGRVRLV